MKRFLTGICLLLTVSSLLCGCCCLSGDSLKLPFGAETTETKPAAESVNTESTETVTEPATESATESTTAPTEPTTQPTTAPTQPSGQFRSYLQEVTYVGAYIFKNPTYDATVVQPMPTGTYTMVAEKTDDEGNLWGKLKSGLGWICLTDIRNFDEPVAIGELDPDMKKAGGYAKVEIHDSDYAIPVVIQACEKLSDMHLYSCELAGAEMVTDELLLSHNGMSKDKVLVVFLEFPGDFSTYELQFSDSNGNFCRYRIATSGRNATLSVWPET